MRKKNKDWLLELQEEFRFFSDLGVDFVFSQPESSRSMTLFSIQEKVLHCTLCPLSRERTQAVPGEGNFDAELMFIGEAPGADEDTQGRPFVGRAGQLLTKIIQAMRFEREDVFITNIVKCRPPGNRTPQKEEIDTCKPYLLAQIKALKPKVIVTLGKVATELFMPTSAGMTQVRGNFFYFGKIRIMPTFHPAYLIRNEGNKKIKRLVWQDMQKVMSVLGKK